MRYLRVAAVTWLLLTTPDLMPAMTVSELGALYDRLPELTLGLLAAGSLPFLVALLSGLRWIRGRPNERTGPLAAATRWATILAILGQARPFNAHDVAALAPELALRLAQLSALFVLLDGPLVPSEHRPRRVPAGHGQHARPARSADRVPESRDGSGTLRKPSHGR